MVVGSVVDMAFGRLIAPSSPGFAVVAGVLVAAGVLWTSRDHRENLESGERHGRA
jgi:hypothetical protein